jgi:hypothetical protein
MTTANSASEAPELSPEGAQQRGAKRSISVWPLSMALLLALAVGATGAILLAHHHLAQQAQAAGPSHPAKALESPPNVAGAPIAYDEATRSVVMFDGSHTWTWNGARWLHLPSKTAPTSSGPGVTVSGIMAFDRPSSAVLLYVPGFQPGCIRPGDDIGYPCGPYHDPATWSWDGVDWHLLQASTPDHAVTLAADPRTGRPLLLTATDGTCASVMWNWSGTGWIRSAIAGPSIVGGAEQARLVADPVSGHLLLLKSSTEAWKSAACSSQNATWEWDGSRWLERQLGDPWPYPGQVVSVGSDPDAGQVLLFIQDAETWTWNGSAWEQRRPRHSPVERILPAMVYDASHGQMLMVGGLPGVGQCFGQPADTWLWSGSDWTQLPPINSHCARS